MPLQQRANKANFKYQWNYTKTRGFIFNREDHKLCPLYRTEPETNTHVVRCDCEEMVEERIGLTWALKEEKKIIRTHPNMKRLMINYIQELSLITLHRANRVLGAEEMTDIVDQQILIGEHNFEAGWWTKVWKENHNSLQNNGHKSKYSGKYGRHEK